MLSITDYKFQTIAILSKRTLKYQQQFKPDPTLQNEEHELKICEYRLEKVKTSKAMLAQTNRKYKRTTYKKHTR